MSNVKVRPKTAEQAEMEYYEDLRRATSDPGRLRRIADLEVEARERFARHARRRYKR